MTTVSSTGCIRNANLQIREKPFSAVRSERISQAPRSELDAFHPVQLQALQPVRHVIENKFLYWISIQLIPGDVEEHPALSLNDPTEQLF